MESIRERVTYELAQMDNPWVYEGWKGFTGRADALRDFSFLLAEVARLAQDRETAEGESERLIQQLRNQREELLSRMAALEQEAERLREALKKIAQVNFSSRSIDYMKCPAMAKAALETLRKVRPG